MHLEGKGAIDTKTRRRSVFHTPIGSPGNRCHGNQTSC